MTLQKPLVEEERWSPVEALIWIATRSRRFVDALKGLPMYVAEDRLWRLRRETFAPYAVSLPDALSAFREQAQRAGVPGLEEFSRKDDDGWVHGLNIFEFALMDISILAADAIRVWPDWQAILAWNAAKTRPWRRPKGFSRAWIRSLPRTEYLPFADVADVLAFGPARAAIGLSEIEEHAARLSAGVAIVSAAVRGEVKLVGAPCERLKEHPHLVRQTGRLLAIDSDALHDLIPVPYGGRDWLGPRRYADEYAEIGHAPQSVSFCEALVERGSFLKWLTAASAKAPGLTDADVRTLVLAQKEANPSVGVDKIVQAIQANDPLIARDRIREIARELGIQGRRGRPKKNSAE